MLPVIFSTFLLLAGCDQASQAPAGSPSAQAPASGALPAGHPPVDGTAAKAAPSADGQVQGTVLETMDAAGYTYMLLDTADGQQWAAVSQAPVTVGQVVTLVDASPMADFHSKALDRTFDQILFASLGSAQGVGHGGSAASGDKVSDAVAQAVTQAHGGLTDVDLRLSEPIAKPDGADGRTVAEVFAQAAALSGQPVAVRGKVVKFNPNILGSNWVHLRDGSGSAELGDHDLTVTTSETVAVGDVITVRGTVATNKDFGAGYTYAVLVEGGAVER